jgi:hypothetical protein
MSPVAERASELLRERRLRRFALHGPRCPECAGPLVFGEGCQACPVCGFSACVSEVGRRGAA